MIVMNETKWWVKYTEGRYSVQMIMSLLLLLNVYISYIQYVYFAEMIMNSREPFPRTSALKKTVVPSLLVGVLSWGWMRVYQERQKEAIQKILTEKITDNKKLQQQNKELYTENMVFHRHGFNKRLVEKGITIYSSLWEFVPYTNEKLNENILHDFVRGMNRKKELLQWLYSSEYEHYKARQVLPGQSLQHIDHMKNDLYTLNISYETETRDIRHDIMALIAEGNFKSLIQEYYTTISFHELFAIARTILSNTANPINTYTLEQREQIMRMVIKQRRASAQKQVISEEHTIVNLVGKDGMFASTQSMIDLYKNITPEKKRHMYQFRDHDFADYRKDTDKIYSTIDQTLQETGEEKRPYTIMLSNHGGVQEDKMIGITILVDGKLYLDPEWLMWLLHSTHNTANGVSTIQYLHCHANNSAWPLVNLLEQSDIDDKNLPVIITQSDSNETSFGNPSNVTPYSHYLNVGKKEPLRLQEYYKAHGQPLGFNASIYVPYSQGITSEEWEVIQSLLKHKKYIKHY